MASKRRRAVGIFPDRPRTASALQALSDSGFDLGHVSVIAKDSQRQTAIAGVKVKDEESNQADTGGAMGALTGGVLGGVTGLLVGLGTLVIPGIGPALLAGEAATVMATLVGGAAGAAAGGLVGALIGMGIPEHRAKRYRDRVAQGDYLVMLTDTEPEIARAERTLKAAGIEDWGVYQPPEETSGARAGSPNATFNGDPLSPPAPYAADPGLDQGVAPGRANPYNRVDHPMDQGYPHRES
ncbi:general stress protein [Leptolyngbya sp. KIOST-1]|uniref:general stress protein n=1 Tax=Leptolyngbya sp. KIOST-1 TaxID=1229172 RepID=UPI001CED1A66|nr:general stress protein [Leptolyngbya sp. KIOST-1]